MVSRYGPEASGQAPARARVLAEGLAARGHAVSVFTTTALDPVTFESVLPAGGREAEAAGTVSVMRFVARGVTGRRTRESLGPGGPEWGSPGTEGPVVPDLVGHVRARWKDHPLLCFEASSWTTERVLEGPERLGTLVPCGPPEPALRSPSVASAFRTAARVLFDTPEDQLLASERLGLLRGEGIGEVIGQPFELGPGLEARRGLEAGALPSRLGLGPYVLHAGPLEARDGCAVLVEQFLRHQRAARSPLSLVLLGRGRVELHESAHVRVLGNLAEAERRGVIAAARAVLLPTRREALAPLCLEAWRESRPVIATRASRVMRGVLERTGGGLACRGFDELSGALDLLDKEPSLADALGRSGRRALETEHALPLVLDRCERVLRDLERGRAAA